MKPVISNVSLQIHNCQTWLGRLPSPPVSLSRATGGNPSRRNPPPPPLLSSLAAAQRRRRAKPGQWGRRRGLFFLPLVLRGWRETAGRVGAPGFGGAGGAAAGSEFGGGVACWGRDVERRARLRRGGRGVSRSGRWRARADPARSSRIRLLDGGGRGGAVAEVGLDLGVGWATAALLRPGGCPICTRQRRLSPAAARLRRTRVSSLPLLWTQRRARQAGVAPWCGGAREAYWWWQGTPGRGRVPPPLHLAAAAGGRRSSPGPDPAAEVTDHAKVSTLGWKASFRFVLVSRVRSVCPG